MLSARLPALLDLLRLPLSQTVLNGIIEIEVDSIWILQRCSLLGRENRIIE